jgi:N,N'-diacetyllegionaminate synthase
MKTMVIAEAGVNHNGDLGLAKKLIQVAAQSGADFVKFQTFNADQLVTKKASKAQYQMEGSISRESQFEMLKRLELNEIMHRELIEESRVQGIGFMSTAFDIESANLLLSLGQETFKIPSGEITNLPYLNHIGQFGKKVLLSTGMSTMDEISAALRALEKAGTTQAKITVLHCTTAYPVPMGDVNLLAMQRIKETFGLDVGYSDHTLGIEIPIAAVALGAKVIEKHFTIDRNSIGPDHKASLEPKELESMIEAIRNIEMAIGDGNKQLMQSELSNRVVSRKSIVAARVIKAGDLFTEDNLTTKRPGTGISPMEWHKILLKRASGDYGPDDLIQIAELKP